MKRVIFFLILVVGLSLLVRGQSALTVYTNHGNFTIELYDSLKPITAGNFKALADSQYYDGVIFHRIISGFVVQGGDPTGTGTGGPGYTISDEFSPLLSNVTKTLSMANSGPNTGGSQFFINLKNNIFLDYNKNPTSSAHPVFGIVRDGWTVVRAIEMVPVNSSDKPITDVVMDSVRTTGSFLSVNQIERSKTKTAVYPNPINSESVLDVYSNGTDIVTIKIYASTGTLMYSANRKLDEGKTKIALKEFGADRFGMGTYYLEVHKKNESVIEKIVVQ